MRRLVPICLVLVACSGELDGGFVVDTKYHAPYTTCSRSGKVTTCTHHPARYTFLLRDCEPAGTFAGAPDDELEHVINSDGQNKVDCVRVWRNVGEEAYHHQYIGEWYGARNPTYQAPPSAEALAKIIGVGLVGAALVVLLVWLMRREYPTWSRRHENYENPRRLVRLWRWLKYWRKRRIWKQEIPPGEAPRDGGYR